MQSFYLNWLKEEKTEGKEVASLIKASEPVSDRIRNPS